MTRTRCRWISAAAAVVVLVGVLWAQQGGRPGRQRPPGPPRADRRQVSEGERGRLWQRTDWRGMSEAERGRLWQRMQERRLTRLRERLGVSAEEWEVLSAPIGRLLEIRGEEMQARMRLRQAAGTEEAEPATLRKALEEYRSRRARLAAEREKLQAQLKELVTLRQEVILVLEGLLD